MKSSKFLWLRQANNDLSSGGFPTPSVSATPIHIIFLMASARQLAFSTGAKVIILETAKDNLSAQKLYEQLGYKRDEEFYRYALSV